MQNYHFIYKKLYNHYGPQGWWPADTAFEMMIGAILVQNTSWRNVEKALSNVKPYLEPQKMDNLSVAELAAFIRPSGFFNVKAKRIKAFMNWFRAYDYDVERIKKMNMDSLRHELLDINGIGRETADVMLLYVFEKSVFVTDAYARRIFCRFGYDMPVSYDRFREQVEEYLPDDLHVFKEYHALLVEHAKQYCKKKPLCSSCPLSKHCIQRIS
ncbi:endonuclease III domain-containing protein [Virgibacillus doumboii]|uniref:endonuclease III domain-containing protein n=1 Tax=Virgibacillus doumboii TaxID=2697503 RepID=UPI0013DEF0C3|nr:endonuclease III domain-containing protein [Virgibacillus doumboii]